MKSSSSLLWNQNSNSFGGVYGNILKRQESCPHCQLVSDTVIRFGGSGKRPHLLELNSVFISSNYWNSWLPIRGSRFLEKLVWNPYYLEFKTCIYWQEEEEEEDEEEGKELC